MTREELLSLADEIERGTAPNIQFTKAMGKMTRDKLPIDNLQDAVDAVPEGWGWHVGRKGKQKSLAVVYIRGRTSTGNAASNNPAAALCAAILRAKAAEMESE